MKFPRKAVVTETELRAKGATTSQEKPDSWEIPFKAFRDSSYWNSPWYTDVHPESNQDESCPRNEFHAAMAG